MEDVITEVSTPAASEQESAYEQDGIAEDTSMTDSPENLSDTDTAEPEALDETAETDRPSEELIAGKFKSQEDLIKAYKEAEPFITKSKELEKAVSTLNEQLKQRAEFENGERLREAQNNGFNSVDEYEIDYQTKSREFELYADNLNAVDPQNYEQARDLLLYYQSTGDNRYLNEAKKFFNADFVEKVAVDKQMFKNGLQYQLQQKNQEISKKQFEALCAEIQYTHKDFLADILGEDVSDDNRNSAKAEALSVMFKSGLIKTNDDMNAFINLYDSISQQAVKDYLAKSESDEKFNALKGKAQIPTGTSASILPNGGTPTYEDIKNMSQSQFNAAVDKYGLETIINAS